MSLDKQQIGARLREFGERKFGERGMSKLAKSLDMTPGALTSTYLSGRSIPGPEILTKLILLGCDIEWLLTGKESPKTINNESPINGHGNVVSNLQGQNKALNKITVGETVELEVLREKVKLLEEKAAFVENQNKLLESIITDLRKQNNHLLNKITGGEK